MRATVLLLALAGADLAHAGVDTAPGPRPDVDRAEVMERLTHDVEKIDRAIEETKAIIRLSLDAPYLPDLYFRLAELYVSKSRFEHARGAEAASAKTLPEDKSLAVQLSKRLAIETYQKIITDFPSYERRDQIHFFRGHEYRELGQWDDMLREYSKLITAYPQSKWSMEARLILGDHYYDKGDVPNAERYYKEILALPESAVHAMARYKLGWLRVNAQDFKAALDLFKDAVVSGRGDRNKEPDSRTANVRREALLAMAWPFSEVRKPQQAVAYFRALADNKALYVDVLRKLANRYFIKSKQDAAALVYREVIRLSSQPEENLEYVERVANAVRDMPADKLSRHLTVDEDVRGMTDTVERLKGRPEPARTRADAPRLDESKIDEELEVQARDISTKAHVYAQNNHDRKVARLAAQAYTDYLDTFAGHKQERTIALDRANALFEGGMYLAAAMQYEDSATAATDKQRQSQVYSAIVGYHRALDEDAEHRATSPDHVGTLNKLQLLRAREGLKQLGSYFAQHYPTSDKVADVEFNVARMYYQGGEFARAADLLSAFVQQFPTHKDVPTAGHLALDALYKLERLDEMTALAEAFAKNTRITSSEFRSEAAQLAQQARKRKVEVTVVGTTEADFSKKMLAEWEKNKGTKEGEDYLYAAFSKFKGQGDIASTNMFGDKLMNAYPSSKYATDVIATMGAYAARGADFERAAWMYEELYRRAPKDRTSIDNLLVAAEIRATLGDADGAMRDYQAVRSAGTPEQRARAVARLLDSAEARGAWDRMADAASAEGRASIASSFYAGLAAEHRGDAREARLKLAEAQRASPSGDAEEDLQARAEFELAHVAHGAFTTLQFRGPATAEAVLKGKLQLLGEVEKQYLATINSGNATWAIAATYELSRLYHDFAAFIAAAPTPAGVSEEQYRAALQQQAEPYVDKANTTIKACAQKAEQLRVLTPYSAACVSNASTEVTTKRAFPMRPTGDVEYQNDMARLRGELYKNPKDTETLRSMARRALAANDVPMAHLVLSEVSELAGDSTPSDAMMGVVLWNEGDTQAAQAALERARLAGSASAALNLAALYQSFGFSRLAKSVMPDNNQLAGIDINGGDIHPLARRMVGGAGGEADGGQP